MALLLGIAACSSSETGGSAAAPMMPNNANADASGSGAAKQGSPPAPGQQQGQQANAPVQERKLVQTARVDLLVKDPFEAISRARSVATGTGGFTGQEDSSGDRASITLQIPADRFDSAIEQLLQLGKPTAQHKQATDVTEQVVDLDARLATQRASVDRMRALLGKAQSVGEIAQIESELTKRESDLESLQGRRDALGTKVALSTVTLQVVKESSPAAAPVEARGGFIDGLDDGWTAFGDFWRVATTVLGALLPFLVVVAIPAGLIFHFRRKRMFSR
ncbi:hypothetical protein JOF56_002686 [Kibdelosporangium banguiense]|uniref:DUF4349 domain-containing protein n=1 Tax=Kibdelosporangium banguiense TaxID=1365924 RepID=A0ABS4TEN5_9PSEU|nr:DUF4349 domain-containing protein [Kibdelosporangium banguiense]MBP2322301.1 hypothetical protein [Kibdelosporangium banguiense]